MTFGKSPLIIKENTKGLIIKLLVVLLGSPYSLSCPPSKRTPILYSDPRTKTEKV